jgi:hypothetical protein
MPSLEARPKAEARSVEDLVDEARKGRLRVPRFQRGLKWGPDDARLLFDSIYRGYPIGTLLFWQTTAEAEVVRYGPVFVDAAARSDAWWVVDGQQRLTSLVRVLLGVEPDDYSLFFDLDEERFVRASQGKKDPSRYLPLTEVVDSERLHQWVSRETLSPERRRTAFRLNKRVREYPVPLYIVETTNEEVLRNIFERTNSSGKALTPADVFDALHGARGADEPADLKATARSLTDLGFGEIEEGILLRSLLAIHGFDPLGGEIPTNFPDAPAAYRRTARAMRAAVIFMTAQVGILHVDLLPYKQPLVALAKFFDLHREPAARSRELLARWIWRGAWSGLHRGDTVSTRATLAAITADEDASVQALLSTIPKAEPLTERELPSYNFRYAQSKLDILALLSLGPRHLKTGTLLAPHSLASAHAVVSIVDGSTLGGTIANRLLHPPIHRLRVALGKADAGIRETHAVSPSAHQALLDGDDERFLAARATEVRRVVQRFLRSRAKWDDNDRPPLSSLRVSDED